jgi:hypothetical protein
MAISTNGKVLARLAGALYNTQMSNATYSEVKTLDPATLADALYARDFSASTDLAVATTVVTNLGLGSVTGLNNWVAAQLTAAGSHKGAKIVDLLNSFAQMTADTTYGSYATAFNTKVDAALAASQTTGNAGGTFAAAGVAPAPVNGTFALTTSIDAIVGGAGDDAITAAATSASTGTANTTVNSGDSVDGGAGTDTLTITATSANNNSLSGLTVTNVEKIVIAGSDNLGTAGAATVAAGSKQIVDLVVAAGAASGSPSVVVTINGVSYTKSYSSSGTAATALDNKATAIASIFSDVLGGTVTVTDTGSGEVKLTSKAFGVPIPTISGLDGADAAWALDAASAQTANAVKTDASAVKEIVTVTISEGSTAGYVSDNTFTVYIDGVSYGSPVLTTSSTQNTVLSALASTINGVVGTGAAVVTGNTMTITAPVAGTPLPALSIKGGGTDAGASTFAISRENVAVGAAGAVSGASVSATQFTGATSISVDGNGTNVTALTTQSVTLSGATLANSLKYSAAATSANVVLSGAAGTVTLTDNSSTAPATALTTIGVTGTVKASTPGVNTIAANGALTINETTNSGNDAATSLNVGITGTGADLTISGLSKLRTFDASTSTGNIKVETGSGVATVKGGSGADILTIGVTTDANSTTGLTSATVNAGAGNDTITVAAAVATGTGPVSIAGDAGNDTVDVRLGGISSLMTLSGGDGTDTLRFAGATAVSSNAQTLTNAEYATANAQAANGFETIRLAAQAQGLGTSLTATDTISIDASKLAGFSTLRFDSAASVTKLADNQAVTGVEAITAQANSYIAGGSAAAVAAGLTATQYGGALTVNASGSSKTVTTKSDSVTLNVSNIPDSSNIGTNAVAASSITLTGDAKTATINLIAGTNYAKAPTLDVISSVTLTPADTGFATAYSAMGNLRSVVLKGVGTVTLNNSDTNDTNNPVNPTTAGTAAGSKLVTIDASQLGGTKGAYDTANVGKPLGGLTYTGNTYLAETVTLGAGQDSLTFNSTYDKMDTIIGFRLVGNTDLSLNTTYSDDLAQVSGVVKVTTGLTATTLDGVLTQVAALGGATTTYNKVVFQFGGDTYFFADSSSADTVLSNADTVVKFVGLLDLDLLVAAFVA